MKKLYSTPDFDVSVYELEDTLAGCLSAPGVLFRIDDETSFNAGGNWVDI